MHCVLVHEWDFLVVLRVVVVVVVVVLPGLKLM